MKILIASSGIPGHLNPLLAIADSLMKKKHEVVVQTSAELKPMVDAAGVPFVSEIPEANTFVGQFVTGSREREKMTPGMEMTGFDIEYFFARSLPLQSASMLLALRDFDADLILADSWYWGTLPMLIGPRDKRPRNCSFGDFGAESVQREKHTSQAGLFRCRTGRGVRATRTFSARASPTLD